MRLPLAIACIASAAVLSGAVMAAAPKAIVPAQPETVTIGSLSYWYGPVEFSHAKHASLAGDCTSCHHKSDGQATPCVTCHPAESDPGDASALILKVAYHDRCLACHKAAGSGPVSCTGCHARKAVPDPATGRPRQNPSKP